MRIVILSDWFSENMGYAAMCLPKSLASLGHEVHVVTSNAQVYYNAPFYKEVYEHFLGPPLTECGVKQFDGYTLHRLPFDSVNGDFRLKGHFNTLCKIKPDVVQTFDITSGTTFQAALYKFILGYKLFTANHVLASVFPLARQKSSNDENNSYVFTDNNLIKNQPVNKFTWFYLKHGTRNRFNRLIDRKRFVNSVTEICYPATVDAADIAVRFFGVSKNKIKINVLGVDTDAFKPVEGMVLEDERKKLRIVNGFNENDIVCIYSGRFTVDKNPLCLARAIEKLQNEGRPYQALFVGYGPQFDQIVSSRGCKVIPFMNFKELAKYYRAADIGIWPRQESTSVLDATACGLPVIISDRVLALERKEGNGLTYIENDINDLKNVLLTLENKENRIKLGKLGVEKILTKQTWVDIAKRRLIDYESALV